MTFIASGVSDWWTEGPYVPHVSFRRFITLMKGSSKALKAAVVEWQTGRPAERGIVGTRAHADL